MSTPPHEHLRTIHEQDLPPYPRVPMLPSEQHAYRTVRNALPEIADVLEDAAGVDNEFNGDDTEALWNACEYLRGSLRRLQAKLEEPA